MTDQQTKLYREGVKLEKRGNALLRRAKAKFAEAYAAGWAADADIGVDSLLSRDEGDGTHPNQMGPWS
jgi:hypothetical protein